MKMVYHVQARLSSVRKSGASLLRLSMCGEMAEFGLRRTTGNRVYGEPYQGFESLSLRHYFEKSPENWGLFLLYTIFIPQRKPRGVSKAKFAGTLQLEKWGNWAEF